MSQSTYHRRDRHLLQSKSITKVSTTTVNLRIFLILAVSFAIAANAIGTPISESDFHSKVVAIYSFEPHKLKEDEMKIKSGQLDEFWSSVKADTTSNLPLLRKELSNPSNSAYFFYDGSKLLLSLSTEKDDQALALRSIPKADLTGLQPTDYLRTVHWFAQNGFDVREAAFRILAYPNFKAFIVQHALTLGQNYSLIYMLFPMDESVFLTDLASRLVAENNVQSQKSLILALWYTVTPDGSVAIKKFADDPKNPEESKTYAKELLARKGSVLNAFSFSTSSSLKEQRRKIMQRPISDEALLEFDELTGKLIAKQ